MLKFLSAAPKLQMKSEGNLVVDEEKMQETLNNVFQLQEFRPMQKEAIVSLLQGHDVLLILPTGGGKSLTFQLPAMMKKGCAVVVSPLIALMQNQVEALTAKRINAALINSSLTKKESQENYQRFASGALKLLYVTPEMMDTDSFTKTLTIMNQRGLLSMFAIDEAHCISEWGHDFRTAFRRLSKLKQSFPNIPIIAVTATATNRVQNDIVQQLRLQSPKLLLGSFNRPEIRYEVRYKRSDLELDTFQDIAAFVEERPSDCGIIYCHKREDCETIAHMLVSKGLSAAVYHAGLGNRERESVLQEWSRGNVRVVAATIAFGMGIDRANVRFVVHMTLSKSMESYYQEAGRAGRDGQPAICILYYHPRDRQLLEFLMEKSEKSRRKNQSSTTPVAGSKRQAFYKLVSLCETACCRRGCILSYFGETPPPGGWSILCKRNCDFCCDPADARSRLQRATNPASVARGRLVMGGIYQKKGKDQEDDQHFTAEDVETDDKSSVDDDGGDGDNNSNNKNKSNGNGKRTFGNALTMMKKSNTAYQQQKSSFASSSSSSQFFQKKPVAKNSTTLFSASSLISTTSVSRQFKKPRMINRNESGSDDEDGAFSHCGGGMIAPDPEIMAKIKQQPKSTPSTIASLLLAKSTATTSVSPQPTLSAHATQTPTKRSFSPPPLPSIW